MDGSPPPRFVDTDYRRAPQMASASRLFTATATENNGQRWSLPVTATPPPLLFSLLSARVSIKWKRVSGTMAARQRVRLPPTGRLNRGHVGLVMERTMAVGAAMGRCSLGGHEVTIQPEGFQSFYQKGRKSTGFGSIQTNCGAKSTSWAGG